MAESVRINRALDNPAGLALALARQASGALFTGDFTLMASQLDEAERLALELGDERILSRLASLHMLLDMQKGDLTAARRRLQDTFQQAANRGDHQLPLWLPMLAVVLHRQGLDVWSARIFGLAGALTGTYQSRGEAMAEVFRRFLGIGDIHAELRAQLGDEAFAREFAAGKHLTLDDLRTIPHPPEPDSAAQAAPAAESAPGESLTGREVEVLCLLAQDLSNPQIAERLVISRRTVDAHLRSIYDKLGVKSRDAAIRVARERGIISSL